MRVEFVQALILAIPMLIFTIWAGRMLWRAGHRRKIGWAMATSVMATAGTVAPALLSDHFATVLLAGAGLLLFAPVALGLMFVMLTGRG